MELKRELLVKTLLKEFNEQDYKFFKVYSSCGQAIKHNKEKCMDIELSNNQIFHTERQGHRKIITLIKLVDITEISLDSGM